MLTRHRHRARRPLALAAALVLATTTVACNAGGGDEPGTGDRGTTGGDGEAPAGSSISELLALVPDSAEHRELVMVALWAEGEAAVDLDARGDDDEERELARLLDLTTDQEVGAGLVPGTFTDVRDRDRLGALGYLPSDVVAEVTAGQPPVVLDVAVGEFDAGVVLDRAAGVDGAERVDVAGTEVVRWLDDNAMAVGTETPIGRLPGQAGRVGIVGGVLGFTTTDAGMEAFVDTAGGDGASLADVEPLAEVAGHLDAEDVHAALLSTAPPLGDPLAAEPEPEDPPSPRLAYAIGATGGAAGPGLFVVFVHEDEDQAAEARDRLEALVAEGESNRRRPWSELLANPRVRVEGRSVVARFDVEDAFLWHHVVRSRDTLLSES